MRGYHPIVGSSQLKKIYLPKQLSILYIKWLKFTPLMLAATSLHRCHSILWKWQLLLVPRLLRGPGHHRADHFFFPDPWPNILIQSVHQSSSLKGTVTQNNFSLKSDPKGCKDVGNYNYLPE